MVQDSVRFEKRGGHDSELEVMTKSWRERYICKRRTSLTSDLPKSMIEVRIGNHECHEDYPPETDATINNQRLRVFYDSPLCSLYQPNLNQLKPNHTK